MSTLQRKLSQNATCISRIAGLDVPKFCGGNFHRWLSNHNICEGFLPRAFPTVWKSAIWSYFSSFLISLSIKLEVPNYWKKHSAYICNGIINYFWCICRAKSEYDEYREKFRLLDSALFCMPPDHRLRRFCNKVLTSQLDSPISGQAMESQELKVFFAARFKFIIWWVMVSMNY